MERVGFSKKSLENENGPDDGGYIMPPLNSHVPWEVSGKGLPDTKGRREGRLLP